MRPARLPLPTWAEVALLPLVNIALAFLVVGVIVTIIGVDPFHALRLLVTGALGSRESIGYTLYYATNFIFTGLAVSIAFHARMFNIGGEGQAMIGGLGVALVCMYVPWPHWSLALLGGTVAAALFGAAWAAIPAFLQAKRGSHIVITTIMFNFIAASLMTYLLVNVLIKPGQQSPESREFGANAFLPAAHELFAKIGITFSPSPLNLAFAIALLAAALVWVLVWRTRWGYALRVAGQNQSAAVYAGISPSRIIIQAMLLSGALAGCLGLNELLGSQHRILIDFPSGAGFVGIAVALMGRNHPVGILVAAVLFGALAQGGSQLAFDLPKINRDMVVVIQGLVILFCGALENVFRTPLAKLWPGRLARSPQPSGGTPVPR